MPLSINKYVPIKPTITPIICFFDEAILNTIAPIITVLRGTNEFKTEATELSISVSAKAKRKAGKKLPRKAEIIIHFHSFLVITFKVFQAKAKIIIDEKIILKEPN